MLNYHRTIYAFDVSECGTRAYNKRPVYLAASLVPEGLKCARDGYIVTANGRGVDVLDPLGQLLVTVQTNYTVNNLEFAGPDARNYGLLVLEGLAKSNEIWLVRSRNRCRNVSRSPI